jgi:hypothetical protein
LLPENLPFYQISILLNIIVQKFGNQLGIALAFSCQNRLAVFDHNFAGHTPQIVNTAHAVAIGSGVVDRQHIVFPDLRQFALFGKTVAGFADVAANIVNFFFSVGIGKVFYSVEAP